MVGIYGELYIEKRGKKFSPFILRLRTKVLSNSNSALQRCKEVGSRIFSLPIHEIKV